jgi:rhodanese-related sulfurtransferase
MLPQELLQRIKSENPPTVVDVLTIFEFRKGHIPGVIHAPTWKILLRLAPITSDRNAELVVTCELGSRAQTGNRRAEKVREIGGRFCCSSCPDRNCFSPPVRLR